MSQMASSLHVNVLWCCALTIFEYGAPFVLLLSVNTHNYFVVPPNSNEFVDHPSITINTNLDTVSGKLLLIDSSYILFLKLSIVGSQIQ